MKWQEKYENFAEFEKSADYKKWLEEKLKDAPIIKVVERQKTPAEIALEKRQEEINRLREEAQKDPNAIISVTNTETGEQEVMTQKEYKEYYDEAEVEEENYRGSDNKSYVNENKKNSCGVRGERLTKNSLAFFSFVYKRYITGFLKKYIF